MSRSRGDRGIALVAVLVLVALVRGGVPAGAIGMAPCERPFIFSGAAVNALVLPFRYAGTEERRGLSETGYRLTRLVQLETLLSMVRYGSVGAVALHENEPGGCDAVEVLRRVDLRPGHGLVLIWGRLFEQQDQLYVQTYVRFLRGDRREELSFTLAGGEDARFSFTASFPATSFAFAPRRLSHSDLERIEAEYAEAVRLRSEPSLEEPGRPLEMDPSLPFAYGVTEVRGDWMHISERNGYQQGWVRARTGADWPLRRKLPELAMIDALTGYLRHRAGRESGISAAPDGTAEAVREALKLYREHSGTTRSEEAEAAGWVIAGMMELLTLRSADEEPAALERAAEDFRLAAERIPASSAARNLAAMPEVLGYAKVGPDPDKARSAVWTMLQAVSLDPSNQEPLANLETCYAYLLQRQAESPAYPQEELNRRLNQIRAVRANTGSR